MGTFYYCDDCMEDGPETKEAEYIAVEMWNGKTKDLCEECYQLRKKEGDLKEIQDNPKEEGKTE